MEQEIWCVMTTVETPDQARSIASDAVNGGLAACVQIEETIISIYKWKGNLESNTEARLLFKLSSAKRDALVSWLRTCHPYDVPEIVAWPVPEVDPAYASWVREA